MPSLLGSRSGSTVMHQIPRQIKKVSVPVVPDITTQKYGIYEMNVIGEGTVTEDFHELEHSVMLQQRNGLLECGKYNKNTKSLTNVLHHVPCTSTTTLMVPSSFCFGDDSYSVRSLFSKRKDCSMNLEKECQENLVNLSPSSLFSLKQRSLYVNGRHSNDLSCNGCHRNSTDSSSSYGSSGFESMKNGSSHVCSAIDTQDAIGSNSAVLRTSSTIYGSSSGLLLNSSQSRLSIQSNSSGDASLIINNMTNMFDDSGAEHLHGDNLKNFSRLSFSDIMIKRMSEAEILALWLGGLGYPEYLTTFLTQGYDLSTIARITPEDLTALGITHPTHRRFLISEIHRWHITNTWPTLVPSGELRDWLPLIGLPEYVALFEDQGYCRIGEVKNFTWEDFEDIGIKKLGHLKRLGLAIRKMKDYEFRQIQSNNSLQQVGTFAVHQNKIGSQVYPQYQLNVANEAVPYHLQGCGGQSLEAGLNKQESDSPQINLCRISRVLSDESFQKHSIIRPVLLAKILSTTDNSISSDSEDYPPPPAPLACEGSIELLRSAFNESTMAATAESSTANGYKCSEGSASTSFPWPKASRRSHSTPTSNDNLLNDIGCMLQI
uniref:SAM domain-containing protein n=1 Tax=Wuchereria bancrofti TaxID=6293 RepID=A0AAF5PHH6_WUCBA